MEDILNETEPRNWTEEDCERAESIARMFDCADLFADSRRGDEARRAARELYDADAE